MNLKELQAMIKEEFDAYMGEAEDDVDVAVSDADVDVDAEMGDSGEEDVLRKIYDLLAAHFEGDKDADDMGDNMDDDMDETYAEADMEEDMVGEVKDDEKKDEAADMEESDGYTGKAEKGGTGYPEKVGGKGRTGYDASSKALQERFQKLANIIK